MERMNVMQKRECGFLDTTSFPAASFPDEIAGAKKQKNF